MGTWTVKVRAYKDDWIPSPVYSSVYNITGQVQLLPPYLSPTPGIYTEPISVSAVGGASPSSAIIRYTTDGTTPTEESPEFATPIEIGLNTIDFSITIRAFLDGWLPSDPRVGVYDVTGQVQLADELFSPPSGSYTSAQSVILTPPILPAGAIMRFTTDGSDPTPGSPAYSSPISLSLNSVTTIKVKAFATDWLPSVTASATYTITGTVAEPVFSPPGGTYGTAVQVTITSATEGAEIRYTTDGSEPTASSDVYTTPITVPHFTQNLQIKAKAYKTDWIASSTESAVYNVLSAPIEVRGFNYSGYIRLMWNIPGTGRALQGFNIYRRTLPQTQYAKLNTALVNAQIEDSYYFDDYDITDGESYEYYVTAVYDGIESPPSSSTVEYYQSQQLLIGASSSAYPNPADDQTRIKLFLNRVEGVQVAVTIYDFVGKKIRTINIPVINAVPYEIAWDLTSSSGSKLGRGTYFARVVATDGSSRTEKVIKIAVK